MSRSRMHRASAIFALAAVAALGAGPAFSQCCDAPDNGSGTADLPPGCVYFGLMHIVDGLPPGTTIDALAQIGSIVTVSEVPGGSLGGTQQEFQAMLQMDLTGTGSLAGYHRQVFVPLPAGGGNMTDAAPRTPGNPVQTFDTDMFRMSGQIIGDPDFDLLRVTGGTGFGMPSPGHTTLTQSATGWAVDSFFDIEYRIDFIGAPGGPLGGMSGSTTATIRFGVCADPVPTEATTWGGVKALHRD